MMPKPLTADERNYLRAYLLINSSGLRCFANFESSNQACLSNAEQQDFCRLCQLTMQADPAQGHLHLIQSALARIPTPPTRRASKP